MDDLDEVIKSSRLKSELNDVESTYGVKAERIREVEVVLMRDDETVWRGFVGVFRLAGHPKSDTCYAWNLFDDDQPQRCKFLMILGIPPINSPLDAVKAAIAAGQSHRQ